MKRLLLTLSLMAALTFGASAQYYSMINQATNMMQTVFSGGMRYRGMVDASYVQGIGNKRADFLEFSTTQGLKYADWFFMGIGAGVDVMFAHAGDPQWLQNSGKSLTTTACMIPLFTDFRFIIGGEKQIGFFIDIKAGCSFLVGKNNVQIGDGYLNRSECFYLKPGLGLRIPVSQDNTKCAFNISAVYNLVTSNYWWQTSSSNITLNGFGVSIGYEW